MTLIEEVAPGVSTNSPIDIPNARAIRKVTASVGLALPRSIWLSIERLTPEALSRASNDQSRSLRSCFNRRAKWVVASPDAVEFGDLDETFFLEAIAVFTIMEIFLASRTMIYLLYCT